MRCEHESCHCQSEVGVERDGRPYCSAHCAGASHGSQETCRCGHAGCSAPDAEVEQAVRGTPGFGSELM
jgi:hypothetical protein